MIDHDSAELLRRLGVSPETIESFCLKHRITDFSLFGSALCDDFRPDSDIDIIVDFEKGATPSLWGHQDLQEELEKIFSREVDLLTARSVRDMRNEGRRNRILASRRSLWLRS